MKDRTLRTFTLDLRSEDARAATLVVRLINPQAMSDSCSMRILSKSGKCLVEGRATIAGLRALVDDHVDLVIARRTTLQAFDEEVLLTVAAAPPSLKAFTTLSAIRNLVEELWLDYSDF
ncbi:MAG TPA: hypothetical protein VK934_06575 [Fimbriimonas sp.]|nr:hypothetical protein [Fimbriimonas sp.]